MCIFKNNPKKVDTHDNEVFMLEVRRRHNKSNSFTARRGRKNPSDVFTGATVGHLWEYCRRANSRGDELPTAIIEICTVASELKVQPHVFLRKKKKLIFIRMIIYILCK